MECDFTGFDIVEVAPAYDTAAQTTALLAANVGYELLALAALSRTSSDVSSTRPPG